MNCRTPRSTGSPQPGPTPARISIVHSYYRSEQTSGENRAVDRQVAALQRAGLNVQLVSQRSDERKKKRTYPLEAALTVATGRGPNPLAELAAFGPDVVHVHNLFPNFARRWVHDWSGMLVATLHNYRPLCPAATFYRKGRVCTDCLDQETAIPSIFHGCYRGRLHTLPLAASTRFSKDPLLLRADKVFTMNQTMRDLYERAGVGPSKLTVFPNAFLPKETPSGEGGSGWLYVGRLSEEKGIRHLLRDWPERESLTVAGSGPLFDEARALAPPAVRFLGDISQGDVLRLMRRSIGLVFPSRWLEGFPTVYVEALASGLPVLASNTSSLAGEIERSKTGLVAAEPSLGRAVAEARHVFPAMRSHCRSVFEREFSEDAWVQHLLQEYRTAAA